AGPSLRRRTALRRGAAPSQRPRRCARDPCFVCEDLELASVNRSPLAMGLLSGRYDETTRFDAQDLRAHQIDWMQYFTDGRPNPEWLSRVAAVRDVLTADGRTLAQGALGWIWARSWATVPVPGVRTVAQAESNAAALEHGPLEPVQLAEIERILADEPV